MILILTFYTSEMIKPPNTLKNQIDKYSFN